MVRNALLVILFCVGAAFSASQAEERIKLATTTSTDNTGLLDALLPPFEEMLNVRVDVIAVGTGKALKLGENGDVDVVLVHARAAEEKFLADGFGVNRRDVMYNDFVLVGPAEDPAGIRGAEDIADALRTLAEAQVPFLSRGDDSGTHKKERALWKDAGLTPDGRWYMESGQGMGPTLLMADEKRGCTLVDRGTLIAYRERVDLVILSEGDPRLFNPYGILAVDPARHDHVNYVYAMALIGWVTSAEGQGLIREFTVGGEQLFHPNAE